MSNISALLGFRPMGRLNGGPFGVSEYGKPATDSNYAIYIFDIVYGVASSLAVAAGGNPAPGVQSGQNGTPGTTAWLGASLNYGALSTASLHYVTDEPEVIYTTTFDDTTNATAASYASKNANIKLAAGSSTTHISKFAVDHTTTATTSTLDLKIIAISNISPNAEGANAMLEVLINKSERAGGTAGQ